MVQVSLFLIMCFSTADLSDYFKYIVLFTGDYFLSKTTIPVNDTVCC